MVGGFGSYCVDVDIMVTKRQYNLYFWHLQGVWMWIMVIGPDLNEIYFAVQQLFNEQFWQTILKISQPEIFM